MGDWEGTVELAETVTVPPLSARIARCRVVRRDDSMVVKVPRNQEILVDPDDLPGVYMARVVATLQGNLSSSNVSGSPPFVVNLRKSSLVESVFSPQDKFVAGSDDSVDVAADVTSSNGKNSSGKCLPRVPEGGLLVAATSHRNDLQAEGGSRPVENQFGIQVDTKYIKRLKMIKGSLLRKVEKIML